MAHSFGFSLSHIPFSTDKQLFMPDLPNYMCETLLERENREIVYAVLMVCWPHHWSSEHFLKFLKKCYPIWFCFRKTNTELHGYFWRIKCWFIKWIQLVLIKFDLSYCVFLCYIFPIRTAIHNAGCSRVPLYWAFVITVIHHDSLSKPHI